MVEDDADDEKKRKGERTRSSSTHQERGNDPARFAFSTVPFDGSSAQIRGDQGKTDEERTLTSQLVGRGRVAACIAFLSVAPPGSATHG